MEEQEQVKEQESAPKQNDAPQQPIGGIEQHKLWAILGYIIPILFFIPLVSEGTKKKEFARFHANQQLILLITWVVGAFLMPFYGIGMLVQLFALVLMIMGIINASGGTMKKLPLVGGIALIK